MRLFIAIELPEQVKKYLKELQEECTGIKASFAKDFHLTLKFLGEVPENKINKIKENLSEIEFEKFKLTLSKVGYFPSESYIKVIWVGAEPEDKVAELQKKVDAAMQKAGFKKDKRFKTHLTIARVRFLEDKEEFIKKMNNLAIEKIGFEVNSFSLIKSTLTKKGPVYEELEKFNFFIK